MNRDEWCKMWESIKTIEYELNLPMWKKRRETIKEELSKIKEQIQSVIGQME